MSDGGISRRGVLQGAAAVGAALVVPVARGSAGGALAANAYISVTASGVELALPKTEMGQGVITSLSMLVAEELGVALNKVRVSIPDGDAPRFAPITQETGGSTSIREVYKPMRQAAARARVGLIEAAARQWGVPPGQCDLVDSMVVAGKRRLAMGHLIASAVLPREAPMRQNLRLIGRPTPRIDARPKITGAMQFGIDFRLAHMKVATLAQCPIYGGMLAGLDEKAALATPGVVKLVKGRDVVFVVADHYWAALQGYVAANVQWAPGPKTADQGAIVADLDAALAQPGHSAKAQGDLNAARGREFSATYHQPFLAHAAMEPLACTIHVTDGACEIWSGSQVPAQARADAAKALGLGEDKVTFHNFQMGGGFGRRLETDMVLRAVELGRAVPYPVKLVWSREEDVQHDMFRPAYADRISAVIDDKGRPIAWEHRIAGSSIMARLMGDGFKGVDDDAIEGAVEMPYAVAAHHVTFQQVESAVPTSWWRGVGGLRSCFVVESFIDELAHGAGADPLAYRLALMEDARSRAVLSRAAKEAGWGRPMPKGQGMGMAVLKLWGTHIAAVVEAKVAEGQISAVRVTIAVDCGVAINPLGIEAQVESGVIFGLSAALYGEITMKDGAAQQSNYHDFRILRMNEAPRIATHIIASQADPGGMGEPPCAVVAPALANAVFAASGQRMRKLPLVV